MKKIALPKSKAKTAYALLTEIRKLIIAEPKRYDQGRFIQREGDANPYRRPIDLPACGTVGCVAGWAATLKHPQPFTYHETERIAADVLGLDSSQKDQLFDGGALSYLDVLPQTPEYAKAGADHIARFQKTYAAQLKAKAV